MPEASTEMSMPAWGDLRCLHQTTVRLFALKEKKNLEKKKKKVLLRASTSFQEMLTLFSCGLHHLFHLSFMLFIPKLMWFLMMNV